jgi:hypothetical protein
VVRQAGDDDAGDAGHSGEHDRATQKGKDGRVTVIPWYSEVVRGPIRMADGFWRVPEVPGLGVEVDEAACGRHPFAPEVMHTQNAVLDDGTIVDW